MKPVKPQSALRGTALLILGRIPSRLLGLVREILAASLFGAGRSMDCFNLSFTLVTGMRQLFAEQFLTPIVPTYFKEKKERGEQSALRTLSAITTRLTIVSALVSVLVFIGAESIIRFLATGFNEGQIALSVTMLRWFAVGGIAIILHRYFVGLYTCFFQYSAIAFTPLLFNLGAIGAMVFFAVKYGVVSLAAGFAIGYILYFVSMVFLLPHRRSILKPSWGKGDSGVSGYGLMLLPLFLAVSVEQVQLIVDRSLASGLPEGALSAQGYSLRLVRMFPDFLLGTFGTVIFPVFSLLASSDRKDEFAKQFSLALQGIILVISIVSALIIAQALPGVRLLLERGNFTFENSVLTSELVVLYTFAYAAQAVLIIIIRGFHAHGNTRIPTFTTVISVIVMIIFDFILIKPMGVHGLALALVIGYCLNMTLVYLLFTRYLSKTIILENLKIMLLGILLSGLIGYAVYQAWQHIETISILNSFAGRLISLIILSTAAFLVYYYALRILRIPAVEFIMKKIMEKKPSTTPVDSLD